MGNELARAWGWWLGVAALAGLLLWPAVYNGFPIIFPDTTAYLNVALGHSWTLDRSGFYGLFLKPFALLGPVAGIWIAVVVQVVAIAAIIIAAVRRAVPAPGWIAVAGVATVGALSSLPWHAAQLMPDAFTGSLILLGWLAASRRLEERGTALLWLAVTVLMLLHYTHLVILPAAVLTCLAVRYIAGESSRRLVPNLAVLILCWSAAVGAQVSANGLMFNRWSVSPMGSYFLFARLNEDGLVDHWLKRHCGRDASPELCSLAPHLPRDSQVLLWGGRASPLDSRINAHLNSPESWVWIDRLEQAALGSLREQPLRFARKAFQAGLSQFQHFQALDDECPKQCSFPGLTRSMPALGKQIRNSRQVQGPLPRAQIRAVSSALSIAGLVLLIPLLIIAARRKDAEMASLGAAILVALCVNALLTGGLSDVHDRYQSRIVWLAPLAAIMAIARWHRGSRSRNLRQNLQPRSANEYPAKTGAG